MRTLESKLIEREKIILPEIEKDAFKSVVAMIGSPAVAAVSAGITAYACGNINRPELLSAIGTGMFLSEGLGIDYSTTNFERNYKMILPERNTGLKAALFGAGIAAVAQCVFFPEGLNYSDYASFISIMASAGYVLGKCADLNNLLSLKYKLNLKEK